jgi:catechol 2,3-dioxygenase-like lactoylglutathione lyase family enzyme
MDTPSPGKVKLPAPIQVGMVVKNLQKVVDFYSFAFGIGPWVLREGASESKAGDRTYAYKTRTAFAPLGPVTLELFEVVEGRSPIHSDWMDKGREGVHHLGFYGSKEERDRIPMELATMGIAVAQERSTNVFLDTEKIGGLFFEIIDNVPPPVPQAPKPTGKVTLPDSLQVGMVVKDVDKVAQFYEAAFGVGPWDRREGRSEVTAEGQTYRFRSNLAFAPLGPITLELFQLVDGRSPVHSHWVDKGREGVHHFGFHVTQVERDRMVADAAPAGIAVAQYGHATGANCTFLGSEKIGGVFFELIVRSPG